MGRRSVLVLVLTFLLSAFTPPLSAAVDYLRIDEVKAGMKGYGLTVFRGEEPERFGVEILGFEEYPVLGTIPIARLSGGPDNIIARVRAAAGMSGSPVYVEVDGKEKLVGAVSLTDYYAVEPIAGITPFGTMLENRTAILNARSEDVQKALSGIWTNYGGKRVLLAPIPLFPTLKSISAPRRFETSEDIQTAVEAISEGSTSATAPEKKFAPGSSITVCILKGDFNLCAAGTVTAVDGNKLFAFGHDFFSAGKVGYPAWRSAVTTIVPTLDFSHKVIDPTAPMGERAIIEGDGSAGIYGRITNETPAMFPFEVSHNGIVRRFSAVPTREGLTFAQFVSFILLPDGLDFSVDTTIMFKGCIASLRQEELCIEETYPQRASDPLLVSGFMLLNSRYFGILSQMRREIPDFRVDHLKLEFKYIPHIKEYLLEDAYLREKKAEIGGTIHLVLQISRRGEPMVNGTREYYTYTLPLQIPPNVKDDSGEIFIDSADTFWERTYRANFLPDSPQGLIQYFRDTVRPRRNVYVQLVLNQKEGEDSGTPGATETSEKWLPIKSSERRSDDGEKIIRLYTVPLPEDSVFVLPQSQRDDPFAGLLYGSSVRVYFHVRQPPESSKEKKTDTAKPSASSTAPKTGTSPGIPSTPLPWTDRVFFTKILVFSCLTLALIVGFVFLLRRMKRKNQIKTRP